MKNKAAMVVILIIIICLNRYGYAYASILKQEVDRDGIITYYVTNEEDKFLAFSMIFARLDTQSRIVYTDKYDGDINDVYDFTDYRHYMQKEVINLQHGIGSYTGSGVIKNSTSKIKNILDYSIYYFETEEQIQYVSDKINEVIKNNIQNLQTDYQKAYFAYRWVLDNASVDYTNSNFSAYSGITGKGTVCQGYSTLYATIAGALGLDNEIIFGGVNGSTYNHAWNAVKLSGQWYCVDTMWGDIANSDTYFLVPKDILASSDYGYHISSMYDNYENSGEKFAAQNYVTTDEEKSSYVMPSVYNIKMDVLKSNKLDIGEGYTFMINNPENIQLIFKSDRPDIATVDNKGIITGISEGTTTITAYNDALKFSQDCVITVLSKKVGTILSDNSIKLKSKNSFKLKVKNALNYSVYKWSSSNKSVAKVTSSGEVTGVSPGKCTIMCQVTNGTNIVILQCNVSVIK
ncbi:Ig-like domain-containing protein [Anaerocolumna sp. MB42-C2]|uniref:Ig-like domain-containing protein n=1 Tax=Anaerocolumna sp. MB42-C2 TaxID=3070997 RepID=UPI0027E0E235|nr:Ig-like domain-containing protein [Anaerocolumna sp. MB42-C2]WMJ87660.1 Ig-like domain-containing protein [Anaerocolumna sp. MB42-C2]